MLYGADVYNGQGTIRWDLAAKQLKFCAAKASEGTGFSDAFFPANFAGMSENNILQAAYHFARPDRNDPEPEARHYLDCLVAAGVKPDTKIIPILDMEIAANAVAIASIVPSDVEAQPQIRRLIRERRFEAMLGPTVPHHMGTLAVETGRPIIGLTPMSTLEWTQTWLQYIHDARGCWPMLYSGLWFMQPHGLLNDPLLSKCGLHLAAYQSIQPAPPAGWDFIAIWQNSDRGAISGINGNVDTDIFNGDEDAWNKYATPEVQPVPEPTKPQMTNNDLAQHLRILLANNTLNPVEAAVHLQGFSD
jgi:lysozyme